MKKILIKKYFNQKEKLTLKNNLYLQQVKKFTFDFIENDLTSNSLIKDNKQVKAIIYAKEKGVIAGIEEIEFFLKKNKIKVKKFRKDGDKVKNNEVVLEISGKIKNILKTERIALNLMQRMSGIATQTYIWSKKVRNNVLLCSTRKTPYNLLDKKAVIVGGGGTHRLDLNDFILIKDNHLKHLNHKTIENKAKFFNQKKIFWEIEVKNKEEAIWAANLKPSVIMFDNFKPRKIKKILKKIKQYYPNIIFEASGQIKKNNIKKYSKTGIDIISCGSITHSIKALDLSLDIL